MCNREHATWRTDYRTSADVRQGTTRRARPLNEKFDNSLFASGGAQVPITALIGQVRFCFKSPVIRRAGSEITSERPFIRP
jgi:hypothetical protein